MTEPELIAAVQSQANDFTPPFEDRIKKAIPLGIAMFCSEYQWEFLDAYTTATTSLDSTTGKYIIPAPSDFFKIVAISNTDGTLLTYDNRNEWLKAQDTAVSTSSIDRYTVIGEQMFTFEQSNGVVVSMVYTRNADGWSLSDLPGQYHYAIAMAVTTLLMPAVLADPAGGSTPNPAYDEAEARYRRAVSKAVNLEMQNKGRPARLDTPELLKLRRGYR